MNNHERGIAMFEYKDRLQRATEAIKNADFIEKYALEDLYTSSFYPFKTQEERWAYLAKHISLNRYDTPAAELYKDLFRLAQR